MAELVKHDIIYANPHSKWASTPLVVPKAGPAEWRFTVDVKPVNNFTIPYHYPMPNVELELIKLSDSNYYANFDFTQ